MSFDVVVESRRLLLGGEQSSISLPRSFSVMTQPIYFCKLTLCAEPRLYRALAEAPLSSVAVAATTGAEDEAAAATTETTAERTVGARACFFWGGGGIGRESKGAFGSISVQMKEELRSCRFARCAAQETASSMLCGTRDCG